MPTRSHTGSGALCLPSFAAFVLALSSSLGALTACADGPGVASMRWPEQSPGTPAQPRAAHLAVGVELELLEMRWGPEGVELELRVINAGPGVLLVERPAILLAWDELEYPLVEDGGPEGVEIAAGEAAELELRYRLGRALTGPGAALVLRGCVREGVEIVDLPTLALPAMPA